MLVERRHRVGEEHRAEAADAHVITGRAQAVHLSIGQPVGDVAQAFPVRQPAGQLEHGRGNVHAEDGSRRRGAACGAGGPAGPAAYVEHMLGGTDAGGGVQPLFMQARLGIEQLGVPDPEFPRGLVRINPRPHIRLIIHPHHHPRALATRVIVHQPGKRGPGAPPGNPGTGKPQSRANGCSACTRRLEVAPLDSKIIGDRRASARKTGCLQSLSATGGMAAGAWRTWP